MSKHLTIGLLIAAVAAITGGILASNLGFQLEYQLLGSASSPTGLNFVSLPYKPQPGIETAGDLFGDIVARGGDITSIQRHIRTTDALQQYTYGTQDFSLVPGEGYVIKMSGGAFTYTLIGSHDPSAVVLLEGIGVGGSNSGTNYYSHPYHAKSQTASALFMEIGAPASLKRFIRSTGQFQSYTKGTNDFALDPGEAYIINLDAGQSKQLVPSHY